MSDRMEVRVVVEVKEPQRPDARAEAQRPEAPAPEPEEGGYGHGV